MKYFVDADGRAASEHEHYIEFQPPAAVEEFWDKTSLYMPEATMDETGFGAFWDDCMHDGIVFDMATISEAELLQMKKKAAKYGGNIPAVLNELTAWMDTWKTEGKTTILVCWESDRALARRRAQRDAYPVNPRFYEEVKQIDNSLSFAEQEEAYEALLCKYHMPKCFFPFPLCEPEKWE